MIAEADKQSWMEQAQLGETAGRVELNGRDELRRVAARMTAQARREILIFTHDLDPPIYDRSELLAAVKDLAIESRGTHVHVLLRSNERVQREGHRLIELARRLPSSIQIRRMSGDYDGHREDFLVVDETGYLRKQLYTRYEGHADFRDPRQARSYRELFTEAWDVSEPDSELRHLHI